MAPYMLVHKVPKLSLQGLSSFHTHYYCLSSEAGNELNTTPLHVYICYCNCVLFILWIFPSAYRYVNVHELLNIIL